MHCLAEGGRATAPTTLSMGGAGSAGDLPWLICHTRGEGLHTLPLDYIPNRLYASPPPRPFGYPRLTAYPSRPLLRRRVWSAASPRGIPSQPSASASGWVGEWGM